MGAVFRWIRDLWLGRRQLGQTTERAAAVIAAAWTPIFTISGGRIIVTQILGEIETGPMAAGVQNVSLQANPGTGPTRALCVITNIANYIVGTLLGIDGINTSALLPPAMSGVIEAQTVGVIVQEGTIELISGLLTVGTVKWTLKWIPFDEGAAVVAA